MHYGFQPFGFQPFSFQPFSFQPFAFPAAEQAPAYHPPQYLPPYGLPANEPLPPLDNGYVPPAVQSPLIDAMNSVGPRRMRRR